MSETANCGPIEVSPEATYHRIKARAKLRMSDGHRFTGVGFAQHAPSRCMSANYLAGQRSGTVQSS